jgi:hypothetical protein
VSITETVGPRPGRTMRRTMESKLGHQFWRTIASSQIQTMFQFFIRRLGSDLGGAREL